MVQHSDMQSPQYTKAIELYASQCVLCYNTIQFNIIPTFYCPTTRLHKDIFLSSQRHFPVKLKIIRHKLYAQTSSLGYLFIYQTYVTSCSLKQNPCTQPNISVIVSTLWFSLCKLMLTNALFSQISDKHCRAA